MAGKKLAPDPEKKNKKRSGWAKDVLRDFMAATGADPEDAVCDLLADLAHWCDRNDVTFAKELGRASRNYDEETGGKGTQLENFIRYC